MRYSAVFSPKIIDKELWNTIYAQVCSRCFGWGLPVTSMIPMADNCNHSHITNINETINTEFQKTSKEGSSYYTRDKFMNDYSALYSEEDLK